MKWSWTLGSVAGIAIRVHATFAILLAWLALSYWMHTGTLGGVASGLAFTLGLFGTVVLHELGHAFTALRFGCRTRDITLLPIGGVARLERMPEKPWQELVVALAGPAVNVALAGAALALILVLGISTGPVSVLPGGAILAKVFWANVALATFNLLPAFPMDGGRALRALLATQLPHAQATRIAAGIGQGMALGLGFLGLFTNPMLVLIGVFVWLAAAEEAAAAELHSELGGVTASRAMLTEFRTLAPDDTLERAVGHVLAGFQHDFPVVERGVPVGVVTHADLIRGLETLGREARIAEIMQRDFALAAPEEPLEVAIARLEQGTHTVPVVRGATLVGLLTPDSVGELLSVRRALAKPRALVRV